jgi:CRISPR-associated protein Cst2
MNLFATILTYPAPSSNYGGETELNRLVIQKVTGPDNQDYPIVSPESKRNALREILRGYGLPCNRQRLHPVSGKGKSEEGGEGDKQQLAVKFEKYPDPGDYIDDFIFGYLLAVKGKELDKVRQAKGDRYPLKRDSILRMNVAKALFPYRHNAVFNQSPEIKDSPWKPGSGDNKASSGLLHREVADTPFQYPFALSFNDCREKPDWTRALLRAIGELNHVAGKHARSYFEMAPASIVVRLTKRLIAGYQTYCFKPDGKIPDVLDDILSDEDYYPGKEFYVGGEIVKRGLTDKQKADLVAKGVTLDGNPQRLLATVADTFLRGQ